MKVEKVDFDKTNQFSKIFTDYINGSDQLRPFYDKIPSIDSFEKQIEEKKSFSPEHRKIVCQALEKQYARLAPAEQVLQNISLLQKENTFTITTGHQLNIFTGPLYFIFKIVSVINTAKELSAKFPDYNFVPVYWMASEDHDFEEISYFRLNGKKIKWDTSQTGAVGRFNPKELKAIIEKTPGIPDFFKEAYLNSETLADAVRQYVNHLFEDYGLVIIDGDDAQLKSLFKNTMEDDLFQHSANKLVEAQSNKLDQAGYKTQVYPREINLFYLKENLRERIVEKQGKFSVLETDISFSQEEMQVELEKHPERFSPNVILRPVFQESILPNLAYFGGPGELAYWFQLKPVFEHFKVPFPILMPRNFALIIPAHIHRKIGKAEIGLLELFQPKHALMKELAIKNAGKDLQLNGERASILDMFEKIKTQAAEIDPTLGPHVEAQQAKLAHTLENIEKKFVRAEKKNQSIRMQQVEDVLDQLFPNGSLQERTDNFLNFFLTNPSLLDQLINYFEPFDFRFNVLIDG